MCHLIRTDNYTVLFLKIDVETRKHFSRMHASRFPSSRGLSRLPPPPGCRPPPPLYADSLSPWIKTPWMLKPSHICRFPQKPSPGCRSPSPWMQTPVEADLPLPGCRPLPPDADPPPPRCRPPGCKPPSRCRPPGCRLSHPGHVTPPPVNDTQQ